MKEKFGTNMKNVLYKGFRKWSVAWICSFINFMYLGVPRLSGMLYLAAITRYNVNRNQASLPFVLCYTVRNVSGPFIGYLSRKVEIRTLIVSGCLISSIGVWACFFAEDITTVSILYGGVFGLGFGLSTILIPCVLNQHFDKYLNNANGIALGGECIAGFVLPPLFEFFLNTYGTSGSFLILSGLILHGVPAALLLRSPEKRLSLVKVETSGEIFNRRHSPSTCTKGILSEIDDITGSRNDLSDLDCSSGAEITNFSKPCTKENICNVKLHERDEREIVEPSQSISLRINNDYINSSRNSNAASQNTKYARTSNYTSAYDTPSLETANSSVDPAQDCQQYDSLLPPDCRQSTEKLNSRGYSIPSLETDNPSVNPAPDCEQCDSLLPSDCRQSIEKLNSKGYSILPHEPVTTSEKKSSYFRIFVDPTFILILFTQSSIIFIATTFSTIVVDFSKDVGVSDDQTVYVLMCCSISDMVGRFCLGWVTDGGYMTSVAFSSMCYGVMGTVLVSMVWLRGFPLIMSAVSVYGLALGGFVIIGPGITSDHIEGDKLNIALASRFSLFAPMSLVQSSMIGYFRDTLGSYNGIFYLLGFHSAICTAFSLLIPFTAQCRERRKLTN